MSFGGIERKFALETLKIIVSALTPLSIAVLGVLLLRRIEGVKASVSMQSDFRKKWADQFFECCQAFMIAFERDMALLNKIGDLKKPDDELGTQLLKEVSTLHLAISELELRIRRSVVFAPVSGAKVKETASNCLSLIRNLINSRVGNLDEIIGKMDEFNRAARIAHAEMIGIKSA